MIFFIANGRLGNQIFQYAFLQTIRRGQEKIVVIGFDELKYVFEGLDCLVIPKPNNRYLKALFNRLCFKIFIPFLNILSSCKIISSVEVKRDIVFGKYLREVTEYSFKNGLFRKLLYVKPGYFQSEKMFNPERISHLRIKKNLLLKAQEILNKVPSDNKKVFVHIRKGDFNDFFVYGKPSVLPMTYYHDLIRWFLENIEKPYFIILSDEPEKIKIEFDYLDNKLVVDSNYGYGVNFAIMTLCEYGILSASTFSWWGAYFMENRKMIFYPKYWLGFHSEVEFPLGTSPSFGVAVDLSSDFSDIGRIPLHNGARTNEHLS